MQIKSDHVSCTQTGSFKEQVSKDSLRKAPTNQNILAIKVAPMKVVKSLKQLLILLNYASVCILFAKYNLKVKPSLILIILYMQLEID